MSEGSTCDLPDFDAHWNFSAPAATEEKFRELLGKAGAEAPLEYQLQLLTQIARTEGLQRKFAEAHLTLDKVQSLLSVNTPVARIRYELERGRVFNSSKEKMKALDYFQTAFDLAKGVGQDNFAVDALHMLAIAEAEAGRQLELNLQAVDLAERSSDKKARKWLGSLYNNIGWVLHDSGRFNEALDMFQRALQFRITQGVASNIRIAKWSMARVLRSLKRREEALLIQKELERENDLNSTPDGYVYEELGELYLELGQESEACHSFKRAYLELNKDEWFKANESKRLQRIAELGGLERS